MTRRFLLAALVFGLEAAMAAPVASGRHWQVSLERLSCVEDPAQVTLDARLRYLGEPGLAEAPVIQLADGQGRAFLPKALQWKAGSKAMAAWFSAGGIRTLPAGESGDLQLRFDVAEAKGDLAFEFGDVPAMPVTRARGSQGVCASLLATAQVQGQKAARGPAGARADPNLRVHRLAYPCLPPGGGKWRMVDAQFPPHLPEQLLVFGRGYLPNARQIELPMGRARAQSYAYAGADDIKDYEDAARKAIAADFPAHRSSLLAGANAKHFAFNWGIQKAASGNMLYAIGLYPIQACPLK